MWKILDTGINSAKDNMEIDRKLLDSLTPSSAPTLHFYEWKNPSATYGYFIKPEDFLDLKKVKKWGIDLARRPTGGGIVFHIWDLAFSVLLPSSHSVFSQNSLENYQFVNNLVLRAVKNLLHTIGQPLLLPEEPIPLDKNCKHFCMAKPTKYDVMYGGRKIAGAAQRKKRQGFLHQGSISIAAPKEEILRDVLKHESVLEAMRQNTFSILKEGWTQSDLNDIRQKLCKSLEETFQENYSL